MVKIATKKEQKDFYNLWRICFEDSEVFSKWLFEKRFLPDFSTYIQKDGKVVCCMQAYPLHISICGNIVKGVMLCGVCTEPSYRKRGLMSQLFKETMQILRKKGFIVAVHTPAKLNSYFSFGHLPVNRCKYIKTEMIPILEKKKEVFEIKENFLSLYHCYYHFSQRYSGIVSRTMADFLLKIEDYTIDGAKVIAYMPDREVKGYAVFYCTKDSIEAVEVVAQTQQDYQEIIEGICSYGKGLKLSIKLPTDVSVALSFIKEEIVEKGVAGVLHLPQLMGVLGSQKGYAIEVEDEVILENNGVFDLDGTKTDKTPDIKLNAGNMTQILFGYCCLEELQQKGLVKIYHEENAKKIASYYQKQNCYIIDEY